MTNFSRKVFGACCLIAGLSMSDQAAAQLLELVPAAPVPGDAVTLRLRPNAALGRQPQFVTSHGYPQITRTGDAFAIRALVCTFPEINPGPMTRDLDLGPLPAGSYSVEIVITYVCTSFGVTPVGTWSGAFLVRGQQTEIPFLGVPGLFMLGLALAGAARSQLRRRAA